MSEKTDTIYSFYQLIREYTITIPVIQRAYAEGRKTRQAEDVRKSIIAAIIKATSDNEPLFFDFVYGNIENNTNFIPFDGQQRLTTLFLFHRYIFERAGEPIELLKKFTYKTRPASSEFIEKLCENKIIPPKNKPLSPHLTNQNWFFDDWKKDPTISSMLIVLDEIHLQISSKDTIDFEKIQNSLTKQPTITFHFVNMEENRLPTATYIKMNARGKTLTAFENFKANLEEYLREKNESLYETLKENIDTKWLDLFYKKTQPALPDNLLMAFFNRHFINMWNLLPDNQKEKDLNKKIEEYLVSFPEIDTFISWDIYKAILEQCNINDIFIPLFSFLNVLNDKKDIENVKKDYDEKWTWLNGSTNDTNKETYPSRVKFFAWIVYFGSKCEYEEKSFENWMRVAFNIIENQTIDSLETYKSALNLIKELAVHSHEIYKHLSDSTNKITSNFAKEQLEEERIKAKKILEGEEWEDKIIKAENHAFFKGAIRFLFHNETGKVDWSTFNAKWKNVKEDFDEQGGQTAEVLKKFISLVDREKEYAIPPDGWIMWQFGYDNKASSWKDVLIQKKKKNDKPCIPYKLLHDFLIGNDCSEKEKSNWNDNLGQAHEVLFKTKLLDYIICESQNKSFGFNDRKDWSGQYALYPYNTRDDKKIVFLCHPRNKILAELCDAGTIKTEHRLELESKPINFFWGKDVCFAYKEKEFIWDKENKVYLKGKEGQKKDNPEKESRFITILDELLEEQSEKKN